MPVSVGVGISPVGVSVAVGVIVGDPTGVVVGDPAGVALGVVIVVGVVVPGIQKPPACSTRVIRIRSA